MSLPAKNEKSHISRSFDLKPKLLRDDRTVDQKSRAIAEAVGDEKQTKVMTIWATPNSGHLSEKRDFYSTSEEKRKWEPPTSPMGLKKTREGNFLGVDQRRTNKIDEEDMDCRTPPLPPLTPPDTSTTPSPTLFSASQYLSPDISLNQKIEKTLFPNYSHSHLASLKKDTTPFKTKKEVLFQQEGKTRKGKGSLILREPPALALTLENQETTSLSSTGGHSGSRIRHETPAPTIKKQTVGQKRASSPLTFMKKRAEQPIQKVEDPTSVAVFESVFATLGKMATQWGFLDLREYLGFKSISSLSKRLRNKKDTKTFRTLGHLLSQVKLRCLTKEFQYRPIATVFLASLQRSISLVTHDIPPTSLKAKKKKLTNYDMPSVVARVVYLYQVCFALYRGVSHRCKCSKMDLDPSMEASWEMEGSLMTIPAKASDYVLLASDWIVEKFENRTIFPLDGSFSAVSGGPILQKIVLVYFLFKIPGLSEYSVDGVMVVATFSIFSFFFNYKVQHLFRLFCHVCYKHWNDFVFEDESSPPSFQLDDSASILNRAVSSGDLRDTKVLSAHSLALYDLPIHLAVEGGSADILLVLLENGGSANGLGNPDAPHPLLIASKAKNGLEIVKLLLEYGADSNATDSNGRSCLFWACCLGREHIVKVLLKNGANPNDVSLRKKGLRKGTDLVYTSLTDSRNCLIIAVGLGHTNIALELLKWGMDPNDYDGAGQTPLFFAVRLKNQVLVLMLLKHGANPNHCDKSGCTPLFLCLEKDSLIAAELLLRNGADPDIHIRRRGSVFHLCLDINHIPMTNLVIQAGGDPFEERVIGTVSGEHERTTETVLDLAEAKQIDLPFFERCLRYQKASHSLKISTQESSEETSSILDLSNLSLLKVPKFVWKEVTLRVLCLAKNQLKTLSPSIRNLVFLDKLDVSHNELDNLPMELGTLNLKELLVKGNPLSNFPSESFVGRTTDELMKFFRQLSDPDIAWKRVKVVVVGKENVGKTTLVTHIVDGIQEQRPNLSTEGITIRNWEPNTSESAEKPGPLGSGPSDAGRTYQLWDFGGQEVFYPTHQFFLSPHSVFVIVIRITDPDCFKTIHYWMESIRMFGEMNSLRPVLIVGTHLDQTTREYSDTVPGKIRSVYGKKVQLILLNTHDESQVAQVRTMIRSAGCHFSLRMKFSGRQMYFAERLSLLKTEMGRRSIKWDLFKELACECGLSSSEISQTAHNFHDLGFFVCFKEYLIEENAFVVLDPAWLVEVLSKLINVRTQHIFRSGYASLRQLAQMWRGYDEDEQRYFLQILEGIGIIYVFKNLSVHTGVTRKDIHSSPIKSSPLSSPIHIPSPPSKLDLEKNQIIPRGTLEDSPGLFSNSSRSGSFSPPRSPRNQHSSNDQCVLIPCFLPNHLQKEARAQWRGENQPEISVSYCRLFRFSFLPLGFVPLLIVRFLNHFRHSILWQNGVLLKQDHSQSIPQGYIEFFPEKYSLMLIVRNEKILAELTRHVNSVLREFYPHSIEKFEQLVPCRHCLASLFHSLNESCSLCDLDVLIEISNNPSLTSPISFYFGEEEDLKVFQIHLFSSLEIRNAIFNDVKPFLKCPVGNVCVRASYLSPDLVLNEIPRLEGIQIRKQIGKGGQATVYLGIMRLPREGSYQTTELEVAVKVFSKLAPAKIQGFLEEASLLQLLDHPNLVKMYGLCSPDLSHLESAGSSPPPPIQPSTSFPSPGLPPPSSPQSLNRPPPASSSSLPFLPSPPLAPKRPLSSSISSPTNRRSIHHRSSSPTSSPSSPPKLSPASLLLSPVTRLRSARASSPPAPISSPSSGLRLPPPISSSPRVRLARQSSPTAQRPQSQSLSFPPPVSLNSITETKSRQVGIVCEIVRESDLQKLLERNTVGELLTDVVDQEDQYKKGRKGGSCIVVDDPLCSNDHLTISMYGTQIECPRSSVHIKSIPIPNHEITWAYRVRVMLDVAKAMKYLHSLIPPIIHRDLRSTNIFLVSRDVTSPVVAKVADFGLAVLSDRKAKRQLLTWQWLAPEVICLNRAGYDARSDVYSFGIVMSEMLNRRCPYVDDYPHINGRHVFISQIVNDELRPIVPKEVPSCCAGQEMGYKTYCELMVQCWDGRPDKRPAWDFIINTLTKILHSVPGMEKLTFSDHIELSQGYQSLTQTKWGFKFHHSSSRLGMHRVITGCIVDSQQQPLQDSEHPKKEFRELWVLHGDHLQIEVFDPLSFVPLGSVTFSERIFFLSEVVGFYSFTDGAGVMYVCCVTNWRAGILLFDVAKRKMEEEVPGSDTKTVAVSCLQITDSSQIWTGQEGGKIYIYSFASRGLTYQCGVTVRHRPTMMCHVDEDVWISGDGYVSVIDIQNLSLKHIWHSPSLSGAVSMTYLPMVDRVWVMDYDDILSIWNTNTFEPVKVPLDDCSKESEGFDGVLKSVQKPVFDVTLRSGVLYCQYSQAVAMCVDNEVWIRDSRKDCEVLQKLSCVEEEKEKKKSPVHWDRKDQLEDFSQKRLFVGLITFSEKGRWHVVAWKRSSLYLWSSNHPL